MGNKPLNESITYPFKGKNAPDVGPVSILVSNKDDLDLLSKLLNLREAKTINLLMSGVYIHNGSANGFSVVGPLIGAPYATILLENLIAWGARQFVFFGWCGAVSKEVEIGDVIVPNSAIIDEGTSKHYVAEDNSPALPSTAAVKRIRNALSKTGVNFREGPVWTTDAIYRETREKVAHFQKKDVLAVEMESSALFTVGGFRNVEVGGILVVSDDLSTFEWRRGFGDKRFIKNRQAVAEGIRWLCKNR
jgi:uridine phosphorylase